jgi:centromeric protein E
MRAAGVCANRSDSSIKQEVFPSYSAKGRREGVGETQRQSQYQFDMLFTPDHDTEYIYEQSVRSVVLAAMNGFHGSVFTYGQTSTGKTYTMQGTSSDPGIIPLAVYECFNYVEQCPSREFLYRVSYLEVYNEQIHDLLNPEASGLKVVDHRKLGAIVQGAKEQVVMTPEHVFGLISGGEAHRHIGSTNVNEKSSRAHTIFRLIIESKDRDRPEVNVFDR